MNGLLGITETFTSGIKMEYSMSKCKHRYHVTQDLYSWLQEALSTTNKLTENADPYYKYTPSSVLEFNQLKLYWYIELHTDETIPANRPDTVFRTKKTR